MVEKSFLVYWWVSLFIVCLKLLFDLGDGKRIINILTIIVWFAVRFCFLHYQDITMTVFFLLGTARLLFNGLDDDDE